MTQSESPQLIGVVSDTHGHVPLTLAAVRMLESLDVSLVIHCGDIGSESVIRLFDPWTTHFVFGNVDHRHQRDLRVAIEAAGQYCHGQFGELHLCGRKIAFLHSDDARRFRQATHEEDWDLVLYGHTHEAKQERIGSKLVVNPGAIYRANPHSLAVIELPALVVTHVTV